MDALTLAISSLNHPLVTEAALLLNGSLGFIIAIAALLLFFEPRWEKRAKVALVIAVALLFSVALKEVVKAERPCAVLPAKLDCPGDFSFPSNHASVAFALMLAFINKPTYPIYVVFALFTAFSRVYLGVHTMEDVFAGLVIAPLAYQTVEILWKRKK